MTDGDDLRVLLRSPALALDPPATLAQAVRRQARRQRLATRAAAGVTAVAAVVALVALGPALIGAVDGLHNGPDQSAGLKPDPRAPTATSDVVTLQTINGADILTWWQGSRWCTATTRITRQDTCVGPVDPRHRGFSSVLPPGSPSLIVNSSHVAAGVLPPDATRVVVHMKSGRAYEAAIFQGAGFVRPVWSVLVDDRRTTVDYYAALDDSGTEIDRRTTS
jgi:hypothetical protein